MALKGDDFFARVTLWSIPRSMSTAFERSIRALGDIKVYHEVYAVAGYYGEERCFSLYKDKPVIPNYKFSDVKEMLERQKVGYRGVFMKDHAYHLTIPGRCDAIPDGFCHTFLIRRPHKTISSFYTTMVTEYGSEARSLLDFNHFRALWELYEYIRDVKGQTPLIIDADDILSDPATMMKKYCEAVGFEYRETMLHWEPGPVDGWLWEEIWYRTVSNCKGFLKPNEAGSGLPDKNISTLPEFIQGSISNAEPYFEELYKLRMKP